MSDTILRTRLYRPKITSDIIIRKELLEKLDNNTDRPLTLVSKPADIVGEIPGKIVGINKECNFV